MYYINIKNMHKKEHYKIVFTGTIVTGAKNALKSLSVNLLSNLSSLELPGDTVFYHHQEKKGITNERIASEILEELKDLKKFIPTPIRTDYGEIFIDNEDIIEIYDLPEQFKYKHIWEKILDISYGIIILIDNTRNDPIKDLNIYLDNFLPLIKKKNAVIGISKLNAGNDLSNKNLTFDDYFNELSKRNLILPIIAVDIGIKKDVVVLLETLVTSIDIEKNPEYYI